MSKIIARSLYSVVFISAFLTSLTAFSQPHIKKGWIDLRKADLNNERQTLAGDWYFFRNQLLTPQDIQPGGNVIEFPKTWNEIDGSGNGYATYALYVLPPVDKGQLAIDIPQVYSSYKLWMNDQLIAENGKPGKTESETIPQWMPQTVSFENPGDTIKLVLQIANFHHNKGGLKDPLYIGSSTLLASHRSMAVKGNLIESAVLFVIALSFLVVFVVSKKKLVTLYFSLLCLTWAIRVGFSNLYLFISYSPDFNWYAMIRIEYITLFLTMIWAILFLGKVFPKEHNPILKYILAGVNCLFIAYALVASPLVFTGWLNMFLSTCGVLLAYGVIVVLHAWINQRSGSSYLSVSLLLGLLVFGYDVSAYEGLFAYNPVIFSACYVIIFSLMGVVLLIHLDVIKSKKPSLTVLTFKDLYKDS